MEEEKEKLEKELEFLKESFESDVISEEEYLSGKERIEKQLKELKPEKAGKKERKKKENKKEIEEKQEELKDKEKDEKTGEKIPEKEIKKEPQKKIQKKESEEKSEEIKEKIQEVQTPAEEKEPEKEEVQKTIVPEEHKEEEKEEIKVEEVRKGKSWKFWVIGLLAIIIIAVLAVPFFNVGEDKEVKDVKEEPVVTEFIACSSDNECNEEGKIGICVNPGTKDAECQFKDIVKTELIIVNTKECFNCDTSRVLNLLKGFFPGLSAKNLDYGSEEGKELADNLEIDVLPAYIFDANLSSAFNFEKIKSAFDNVDGKYVMNKEASGATYFANRNIIPKRLDVFLVGNDASSIKAEQNLEEFLNLFGDKIEFFKHNENDALTRQLEIRTFPTFLINNKIKFSGVQPADKIKENFCQLNDMEECEEELTKSLV